MKPNNRRQLPVYVYHTYECPFFGHCQVVFFRPRVFSRVLSCDARRGARMRTAAQVCFGRAPWRVLWAFQVAPAGFFHGIAFYDGESPRTMETMQYHIFALMLLYHTVPPTLKLSILCQPRYNSRTSSFLCDVWVRVRNDPVVWRNTRNEHIISKSGVIAGAGRCKTTLPRK